MCVASVTAEHLMEACLKRLGVRNYFGFLLSCETVGAGKRSPLTEMQKATDPLGWTRIMNNIRNRAEEIVLQELIYTEDAV